MKSGTTYLYSMNIPNIVIDNVEEIVFTIVGKETITKTYPDDVEHSDGKFLVPLNQEETASLAEDRIYIEIEAQINFKNKSVAKTQIKREYIESTLATKIVDDSVATQDTQNDVELVIDGNVIINGGTTKDMPLSVLYFKDAVTDKIYSLEVKDGVLTVSEAIESTDEDDTTNTPPSIDNGDTDSSDNADGTDGAGDSDSTDSSVENSENNTEDASNIETEPGSTSTE